MVESDVAVCVKSQLVTQRDRSGFFVLFVGGEFRSISTRGRLFYSFNGLLDKPLSQVELPPPLTPRGVLVGIHAVKL